MKAVWRLPMALCGLVFVAACDTTTRTDVTQEGTGFDCDVPARIGSPVTISVVSDTAAQGAARAVAVDKPVVVACVGDPLEWQADPGTILAWEIDWDAESPLAERVPPTGDESGRGGGEAATVGIFKYTVRVTTTDSVQIELDPDAVIMPGR